MQALETSYQFSICTHILVVCWRETNLNATHEDISLFKVGFRQESSTVAVTATVRFVSPIRQKPASATRLTCPTYLPQQDLRKHSCLVMREEAFFNLFSPGLRC